MSQHPVIMGMQLGHAFLQVTKMPSGGVFRMETVRFWRPEAEGIDLFTGAAEQTEQRQHICIAPVQGCKHQAVMLDKERVREQVV